MLFLLVRFLTLFVFEGLFQNVVNKIERIHGEYFPFAFFFSLVKIFSSTD